jgi:hypothetical protein
LYFAAIFKLAVGLTAKKRNIKTCASGFNFPPFSSLLRADRQTARRRNARLGLKHCGRYAAACRLAGFR